MNNFSQVLKLTWMRLRLWWARRAIDRAQTRAQMQAAVDNVIVIHRQIKFTEQERR